MTEPDEPADAGVLASLPSSRPQRRSPKRDATAGPTAARAPRKPPTPVAPAAAAPRAPIAAQGYEVDTARGAVDPPSRTDVVGAVVQGAGDLAHIGLDAGRHILHAILDRLPTP